MSSLVGFKLPDPLLYKLIPNFVIHSSPPYATCEEAVEARHQARALMEYSSFDWSSVPRSLQRRTAESAFDSPKIITTRFRWQHVVYDCSRNHSVLIISQCVRLYTGTLEIFANSACISHWPGLTLDFLKLSTKANHCSCGYSWSGFCRDAGHQC